jgi:DNA-directed RNA polymerase subunit H (RpoH/RPB5)
MIIKKQLTLTLEQFPEIGRFDPVSLALCLRPGEICKIHRPTPTAGTSMFYRVCV